MRDRLSVSIELHSLCSSIDIGLNRIGVFHNGHIQAVQVIDKLELETDDKFKFMTVGQLLGPEFVGSVTDVEVFGRPLPDQELLKGTLGHNQV